MIVKDLYVRVYACGKYEDFNLYIGIVILQIVKPCGRINSLMVVGRDTLYLYGGMMEIGEREVTLDDLYSMDLNKLDAWNLVIEVQNILHICAVLFCAIVEVICCRELF